VGTISVPCSDSGVELEVFLCRTRSFFNGYCGVDRLGVLDVLLESSSFSRTGGLSVELGG